VSSVDHHRPGLAAALTGVSGAALCLLGLFASGRTLPLPDITDLDGVVTWARTVGAATVAFTGLRAVAMALFGWWLLAWVVGALARRTHRPRVVAAVDRVSPRFVRHLAEAAAGLGIVVAGLSPTVGAGAAHTAMGVSVAMVDLGPVMTDLGAVDAAPTAGSTSPPSTSATPTTTPPAPTMTSEDRATPPDGSTSPATWTIEPGDTLWHVAEITAAESLGRPADTAEVAHRLDELVALNADRLAVPGDPSLVFPGQRFLLG
jgi:hypothetical protein